MLKSSILILAFVISLNSPFAQDIILFEDKGLLKTSSRKDLNLLPRGDGYAFVMPSRANKKEKFHLKRIDLVFKSKSGKEVRLIHGKGVFVDGKRKCDEKLLCDKDIRASRINPITFSDSDYYGYFGGRLETWYFSSENMVYRDNNLYFVLNGEVYTLSNSKKIINPVLKKSQDMANEIDLMRHSEWFYSSEFQIFSVKNDRKTHLKEINKFRKFIDIYSKIDFLKKVSDKQEAISDGEWDQINRFIRRNTDSSREWLTPYDFAFYERQGDSICDKYLFTHNRLPPKHSSQKKLSMEQEKELLKCNLKYQFVDILTKLSKLDLPYVYFRDYPSQEGNNRLCLRNNLINWKNNNKGDLSINSYDNFLKGSLTGIRPYIFHEDFCIQYSTKTKNVIFPVRVSSTIDL